jgi:hypothetical protein
MQVWRSSAGAFQVTVFARFVGKKVVRSPFFCTRPESARSLSLTNLNDGDRAAGKRERGSTTHKIKHASRRYTGVLE